jgi:signal transduction histidine kinase/ActR/RegA family two-component response regulator
MEHFEAMAQAPARSGPAPDHAVQFYESDDFLCDAVARFFVQGVKMHESLLVVATAAHREGIDERLAFHGFDLLTLCRRGRATFVDAHELLSTFMVGSTADATLFTSALGDVLEKIRRGRDRVRVRIYGEMVDLLWRSGRADAALRLEELWNELAATHSFSLLCGYSLGQFHDAAHSAPFEEICRQHAHTMPTERFTRLTDEDGRLREIARLQQQAYSLAAELEHRKELEQTLRRTLADRERSESERERLLAREQAAREDAETANRLKDEFLAVVSHELRTPLNAILGWAQILTRPDKDLNRPNHDEATVCRGLDVIQRNARVQLHVIDDLLDMSRIITGKMVVRMAQVDLIEVLGEVVETVRPAVTAKSIDLDLELEPAARYIAGDRDRLQQIMWNLLSNAIKFTPLRGRIGLRLERVDADAQIVVRDNGQGIPAEFLPYVFDRFRQADTGTTRMSGGLGIGLAVVRHLVQAHGGTIAATSAGAGLGATFTLRLPVRPTSLDASQHPVAGRFAGLGQARVLAVDDDPDSRDLFGEALRMAGASVQTAASVEEALQKLSSDRFDMLIADIGMPGRDGYALIEAIRRDPQASIRGICAIAVTSFAGDSYRDRARSSGYDDYVIKPVDPGRLAEIAADLLRRKPRAA